MHSYMDDSFLLKFVILPTLSSFSVGGLASYFSERSREM